MATVRDLTPEFLDYLKNELRRADQTIAAYRCDLRELAEIAGDLPIEKVDLGVLRTWLRKMNQRGLAVGSVRRRFHCATSFWNWLRLVGLATEILPHRVQLPTPPKRVPHWLSPKEVEAFLRTVPAFDGRRDAQRPPYWRERDSLAWHLLVYWGVRRGELLNIRVGDVRYDDGVVLIREGKTKQERLLPLVNFPTLIRKLKRFTDGRSPDDYLLPGTTLKRVWKRTSFMKAFKRHVRATGIKKHVYPHMLRHTLATHLTANGTPAPIVQRILGHEDIKSTMIYTHVDLTTLRKALEGYKPGEMDT